jgi:glycosyltransferase involved in cell wall biosynthesis
MTNRFSQAYLVTYLDGDLPQNIMSLKDKGLNIIHRRPRYFHSIQKFLFFAKTRDFKNIIRQIKPDIIHSGFIWKDGFLAALSGFHPHLIMPWGCDVLRHPDMFWICRQVVRYSLRQADAVICDCQAVKTKVKSLAGRQDRHFIFFRYGLDPKVFNKDNRSSGFRKKLGLEGKKVLISTRNLYYVYNIDLIIKAFPDILKHEPLARVIITGSGPEESRLKSLVRDMGLEGFIFFTGPIPNHEMPSYLNDADIYISTSLSDGTSQSLFEAFSCGMPVIVTDVPANMEWVKDGINGLISPIKDEHAFACNVVRLFGDEALRKKMSAVNLDIARNEADWNKNFDKLQKAYEYFAGIVPSPAMR